MKAVYLAEAHNIAVKEVDEPVVGPSDVLLNLRSGAYAGPMSTCIQVTIPSANRRWCWGTRSRATSFRLARMSPASRLGIGWPSSRKSRAAHVTSAPKGSPICAVASVSLACIGPVCLASG
jgi:hypothetical protein